MFDTETIWAFDLGKASIGEVVRRGNDFPHKASLLIPAEFAETRTAATRRRMWRTRIAHRERERWLEQVWAAARLPVLYGRNRDPETGGEKVGMLPDERLEREFGKPGDETCYTSCLLRIKLLRGEKLADWQIFKALRSAIQKRGYDTIPWAAKEARRAGKSVEDLEKEEQKNDANYVAALDKWRSFKKENPSEYHFPCYFDAWKMKLWQPATPQQLNNRITHQAESTRNIRFDRADVEREIIQLANNAAKLLPALAGTFARLQQDGWTQTYAATGQRKHFPLRAGSFGDFLCHGPAGRAYASFYPETRDPLGLHLGSADDWMGALGQKIPRFDNRILEDCVLIPRFHVCKVDIRQDTKSGVPVPDSLLPAEVTFLMKLKNTLVAASTGQRKLGPDEVRQIFSVALQDVTQVKADAKEWPKKIAGCFALTKAAWGRKKGIKDLELRPLPGHEEVKSPKDAGRSGFARPALRLLKQLILSGRKPGEFHAEQLAKLNGNTNPMKGLVPADLRFLLDMGDSWEDIHVPAQKLEALTDRHTEDGKLDVDEAVADLLGTINDPVVRHRLSVFAARLRQLQQRFGMPGEIVLEFVREDFMGPKRKAELLQFQRDREKARKEARDKAREAGAEEKSAALKYELLKDQGGICLFTGAALPFTSLSDYEIEHIVPRNHPSGIIGPDAMINYVLTKRETNAAKANRTPFEWFHADMPDQWDAYQKRVQSRLTALRNKKVQLLLREDAPQLVERYTALAETAWVSKLAQTIASLYFGWKNGNDAEGRKRVTAISGGLTARVRRKYRLNSLLNPCPATEDSFAWEEKCEKNRSDHRHHALDAMVISFIPGWARDPKKEGFFRFPPEVHQNAKEFFQRHIAQVMPKNLCFERATLAETIYGMRATEGHETIVRRVELGSLAFKPTAQGKTQLDLDHLANQIELIRDANIQRRLREFHATGPNEEQWKNFSENFTQRADGSGSHVRRVLVNVGEPTEYKDMSKDSTGAYRRAIKGHQGQLVFIGANGKPYVQPVYVFDSIFEAKRKVLERCPEAQIVDFFNTGCLVELMRPIEHPRTPLPVGRYLLNTITEDRRVRVTDASGQQSDRISLEIMMKAGFRRAD
jgi:CRISPR-associated endonuclease Csn1